MSSRSSVTTGVRFFGFKCLFPGKADRLLWVGCCRLAGISQRPVSARLLTFDGPIPTTPSWPISAGEANSI